MTRSGLFAYGLIVSLLLALASAGAVGAELRSEVPERLPVPGQVNFIDLGTERCPPCKAMEPTLEEVAEEYRGRAAVIYVDVLRHHQWVSRFGVSLIPTQLFFDPQGRLIHRHEGYMSKARIQAVLSRLGVPPPQAEKSR